MEIEQRVQVQILGAYRTYTYAWHYDPLAGGVPVGVGDKVELPPNQVQEEGSSGTVVELGSPYTGPVKDIVRILTQSAINDDSDLWAGFGEGDYA